MGGILRCTFRRPRQTTAECHCHHRCRHQCQHWYRGELSDNDNDIESSVVGSFGIERINDAGRRLRVFMETHEIAALSTFFNKKYYSTWTHPVSKCAYQIDHIFTLRENLRHFADAGSVSGQLVDSDHRAVKATLRSLVAPKKKKVFKDDRHKLMRLDCHSSI